MYSSNMRPGTTAGDIGQSFSLRSHSEAKLRDYSMTSSQSSFSKMPGLTDSWARMDGLERKPMVKALQRSSVKLGFFEPNFVSTSSAFRKFSRGEQRAAQGAMNDEVKADLRAVHYSLGEDGPGKVNYDWYETELQRCAKSHWDPARRKAWPPAPDSPKTRAMRIGQTLRSFRGGERAVTR
ncbi:unnamed protein product [Effrenium voratum]|uniref:Uncharacterized protein n=1 Tax=Effrenium voratum TaxID=2562239 RepID=A0AA36N3K1_9DINO|nr:unnamed protein product [Effrenium voratum]